MLESLEKGQPDAQRLSNNGAMTSLQKRKGLLTTKSFKLAVRNRTTAAPWFLVRTIEACETKSDMKNKDGTWYRAHLIQR